MEGEVLHLYIHVTAHISCKAGSRLGAGSGRNGTAAHRGKGHNCKLDTQHAHLSQGDTVFDHVDHVGGKEGYKHLNQYFESDKNKGHNRGFFILPETFCKGFDYHCIHL